MEKWRQSVSAIQELAPYIEEFQGRIKRAKEEHHYTIEQLSDLSGVSSSVIAKTSAGTQNDPRLYNSAALCKVLELSLDELFGLAKPADTNEGLQERIRLLELQRAEQEGASHEQHTLNELLKERVREQRSLIFILICMTVVLSFALTVYLFIDLSIRDQGLILWGSPTGVAWLLIFLIIAAVIAIGVSVYHVFRPQGTRKK